MPWTLLYPRQGSLDFSPGNVIELLKLFFFFVKTLAKQNINLFLECLKEEQGEVKVILQTVFDVGVTFGMAHFNNEDNVRLCFFLLFFSFFFFFDSSCLLTPPAFTVTQ